jgi:hypothetical protein
MSETASRDEQRVETECGHQRPAGEVVSVPEVGYLCRQCHTPIPLSSWEEVIDKRTVSHRTGEKTVYRTWLVGLDAVGRPVYLDERAGKLLRLVPKYHHSFKMDVSDDDRPFRQDAPKFGGRGEIVNAPDNGVLTVYDVEDTRANAHQKVPLCEWVVKQAGRDDWNWTALSERTLELLDGPSGRRGWADVDESEVDAVIEAHR